MSLLKSISACGSDGDLGSQTSTRQTCQPATPEVRRAPVGERCVTGSATAWSEHLPRPGHLDRSPRPGQTGRTCAIPRRGSANRIRRQKFLDAWNRKVSSEAGFYMAAGFCEISVSQEAYPTAVKRSDPASASGSDARQSRTRLAILECSHTGRCDLPAWRLMKPRAGFEPRPTG